VAKSEGTEISGNRVNDQASNAVASKGSSNGSGEGKQTIAFAEAALVRRCQQGETEAFAELVERYQDRIYNLIFRMCGRRADADELAQETFLRAFERIGQFRGNSRFYTWLFRIAANLTLSHRRRGSKVKFLSLDGSGDRPGEDQDASRADVMTADLSKRRTVSPEASIMGEETHHRVMDALGELDEEFRAPVILRDIEGLDYNQIAEVLELPVGTIKSRLHRGRFALKEKLADLVSP
jgi:RNA polymerase sigma-70 factor (ECF subfamily)